MSYFWDSLWENYNDFVRHLLQAIWTNNKKNYTCTLKEFWGNIKQALDGAGVRHI